MLWYESSLGWMAACSQRLMHAVARTLGAMYSIEGPCKPFTRMLLALSVTGMWKFGVSRVRCWRGRMLWESTRVLSVNREAKRRQGDAELRLIPGCIAHPKPRGGGLSLLLYLLSTLNQFAQADPDHSSSLVKECVSCFTSYWSLQFLQQ